MIIICTSGLHRSLAKEIIKNHNDETCKILSLDKAKSIPGKLRNLTKGLFFLTKTLLTKNSHVIVPHPFNPWFSLFIFASSRQSIFDDGIAYYYDAKIPNTIKCKIYAGIAKKLNKGIHPKKLTNLTYKEYLETSTAEKYYCLYEHKNSNNLPQQVLVTPKEHLPLHQEEGYIVFLDSSKEISSKISSATIINTLKHNIESGKISNIHYKPHPRSLSNTSEKLEKMEWAVRLDGDYEEFINNNRVIALYSIYSSATITTRMIQPSTKVYCFTNEEVRSIAGKVHDLFEREKIEFIES